MTALIYQDQDQTGNTAFGLAVLPLNLSRYLAKPRHRKESGGTEMSKAAKQLDCGESPEASKNNKDAMAEIVKASLNLVMRRSFAASPSNVSHYCTSTGASTSDSTTETSSSTDTSWKSNHVAFHTQVEVHETISLEDISDEECAAAWYSQEEFDEIRRNCCKLILKVDRGDRMTSKQCIRGLESHTHIRALVKQKNRSDAIQAALSEQSRQVRQGIREEGEIALVYRDGSASSQLWANVVGLQDQYEAECVMDDFDELSFESSSSLARREGERLAAPEKEEEAIAADSAVPCASRLGNSWIKSARAA